MFVIYFALVSAFGDYIICNIQCKAQSVKNIVDVKYTYVCFDTFDRPEDMGLYCCLCLGPGCDNRLYTMLCENKRIVYKLKTVFGTFS